MLKRLSKNVRIRQEIFKKLRNIRRKEKYLRFENENENENSQFFKIAQRKGAQPPSTSVAAGLRNYLLSHAKFFPINLTYTTVFPRGEVNL